MFLAFLLTLPATAWAADEPPLETRQYTSSCFYGMGCLFPRRSVILGPTSVTFEDKSLVRTGSEVFAYDKIDSVRYQSGCFFGSFTVYKRDGRTTRIVGLPKQDAEEAKAVVEDRLR